MSERYGIDIQKSELANLEHPEYVLEAHESYLKAGARAIKTNTFNVGTFAGAQGRIIKAGCEIAKMALKGSGADIYASIGPFGLSGGKDVLGWYKSTVETFLNEGINKFLFETFPEAGILVGIAEMAKRLAPGSYIIAECSLMPGGFTRNGVSAESALSRLAGSESIDACGFNCSCGPVRLIDLIKTLKLPSKTFCVMPNAGYPDIQSGRTTFDASPQYFAQKLLEIRSLGASIIGGCCGTTPGHIQRACELLDRLEPGGALESQRSSVAHVPEAHAASRPRSILYKKGVIAVELDSPADGDTGPFMKRAKKLSAAGADLITIADCPVGRARLDSSMLAAKLRRDLGIEAMPHMACRDRNLNAIKALLMGLYAENIGQVLAVTGDPIPSSARDEITSVFNFNSVNLAAFISGLNADIFAQRPLAISAALNVNAANFGAELSKAWRKAKNGVTVFLTQPIFSTEAASNLKRAAGELPAKILAGIMPIASYRSACYMNNEVAGISIPGHVLKLYEHAGKEESARLAVELAMEMIASVSGAAYGHYIITPLNRASVVCEIIGRLRQTGPPT